MKISRTSLLCFFLWMASTFLFGIVGTANAADCDKAKEIYKRGTQLLRFDERRQAFQKAIELCPSFAEAHVNLADAFQNLGLLKRKLNEKNLMESHKLLDKAEGEYKKALDLNRELYAAHLGLAEVYLARGAYPLAEERFKKILILRLGDEAALRGLQVVDCLKKADKPGPKSTAQIMERNTCFEMKFGTMGPEDYTVEDRQTFENILFAPWKAEIGDQDSLYQLKRIGEALRSPALSGFAFVIEGHASHAGGFEDNMRISWDRARRIKDYLVKDCNVEASRLFSQGFGNTRPKFPEETQDQRNRNRRVEILFLKQTGKE